MLAKLTELPHTERLFWKWFSLSLHALPGTPLHGPVEKQAPNSWGQNAEQAE